MGHLWFLPVLFAFFVILTAVWVFEQQWLHRGRLEAVETRPREMSDGFLVIFGLFTTLCVIVLSCFYDYGEWRHLFGMDFLSYQPSRVYVDMCYFFLGIYLRRKGAFSATPPLGRIARWLIAAAVLSVIFLWFRRSYGQFVESSFRLICINAFLHCMTMLSLFAVALFGCRRWLNFSNKSTRAFSANSFTIYLIHQPLMVVPLQYALLRASTNCYSKFAIVFTGSLVLSFLMSHFVLRRIPGLQAIL